MLERVSKKITRAIALICVGIGAAGAIFCLPFAVSPRWLFVKMAGVYFIAAAIMITGGLITIAILAESKQS